MMEDPTRFGEPPHFKHLYLEEIHEMDERARMFSKEAEMYENTGRTKDAAATQFIAKTYTATVDMLMKRAISEPLADA